MNKLVFLFSGLIALLGIVALLVTSIINKVLPKIGYAAFQAAASGQYSDGLYKADFTVINFFAVVMIVAGVWMGYKFYMKEVVGKKQD